MAAASLTSAFVSTFASIPSPSSNGFELGPLTLRYYGMMISLGVLAAVALTYRRMPGRRFVPDVAGEIAIPGVLGGFVGSRLYHVITDANWSDWYKVWEGGLGIPGGIIGGTLAVMFVAKRRKYPLPPLFDIVAPSLPLAQAIGRIGNWFNQELFGGPLDTFWGLEIDPAHRPNEYASTETFHPTFLYESLWNIGLTVLMLWVDRKRILKPGRLFFLYMAGYALGRLWIEALRIDPATEIAGLRINLWTMGVVLIVGVLGLVIGGRLKSGEVDPYRVNAPVKYGAAGGAAIDDEDRGEEE